VFRHFPIILREAFNKEKYNDGYVGQRRATAELKLQTLSTVQDVDHNNYHLIANNHLFYSDTSISNGATNSLISYASSLAKKVIQVHLTSDILHHCPLVTARNSR
jgi:hypothetical protein